MTQLLPRSQVVRWSGWPLACCMCSLNLTSSEKQSSRPAIKPFQFLSDEFEISNPEIQPPPFPLWEVGAGMGRKSWRDNFVTHSVRVEWRCPLSKEPNPNMDFASTIIVDGQAQNWTKQLKYRDQQLQKFQVLAPHLLQIWTVLIQPSFNIFYFHFKHLSSDLICSVLIWPTC